MTEADKWDPSPLDALLLPYTGVDEASLSKHPEGPRGVPTYPGLHNEAGLSPAGSLSHHPQRIDVLGGSMLNASEQESQLPRYTQISRVQCGFRADSDLLCGP